MRLLPVVALAVACSSYDYGFVAHLEEAIALNTERQPLYARETDNASSLLSQMLIGSEQITLSQAELFDERAEPFHDEGIPIVAADFVSMRHVALWDRPPAWTGPWSEATREALDRVVDPLLSVDPGDFEAICARSRDALEAIDAMEPQRDVHLAMSRHVIESLALAALHGLDYAERSDGRTEDLSRDLVDVQLDPLRLGLAQVVDERASALHALGIGIIVNDVPHIPFLDEYERHLERARAHGGTRNDNTSRPPG